MRYGVNKYPTGTPTAHTCEGRRVKQRGPDPPLCGAPRGNEIRTKFANLTPGAKPGRFYNRISPAKWLIHFFRFTRRIKVYWVFYSFELDAFIFQFQVTFWRWAIFLKNELRSCWPICHCGAQQLVRSPLWVPLYINRAVRYSTPESYHDLEN